MKSSFVSVLFTTFVTFMIMGCSSTTGVVRTGPDTFMISCSKKGFKNGSEMKAEALKQANDYCTNHGKIMKVVSSNQKDMVPFTSDAYAEVHFKCLSPDDPEASASTDTGSLSKRVYQGEEKHLNESIEIEKKVIEVKAGDVYEQIEKLGDLMKKGLITQEEFAAAKKKLLAK